MRPAWRSRAEEPNNSLLPRHWLYEWFSQFHSVVEHIRFFHGALQFSLSLLWRWSVNIGEPVDGFLCNRFSAQCQALLVVNSGVDGVLSWGGKCPAAPCSWVAAMTSSWQARKAAGRFSVGSTSLNESWIFTSSDRHTIPYVSAADVAMTNTVWQWSSLKHSAGLISCSHLQNKNIHFIFGTGGHDVRQRICLAET